MKNALQEGLYSCSRLGIKMERGQVGSLFCHCMSWLFTFLQHNLACMIFISPSLSPSDLEMGVRNSTEVMGYLGGSAG